MSRHKGKLAAAAAVVVSFVLVAVLATGCGSSSYAVQPGTLAVASDSDVIPFEALQNGKPVGFDVELAQAVAAKLGLKYKFVPISWNNLLPDLQAGKYDMVMASMTITYDRSKIYDFSAPYFNTNQSIVVTGNSPIKNGTDLTGKVVGVLNASTPQYAAEQIKVIKEIKKYDSVAECYAALLSGQVDAMIMDLSIAKYRANTDHQTSVVAEITTGEQYGVAMKKGNSTLKQKIDGALSQLKKDGTYQKIYNKWFGSGQ